MNSSNEPRWRRPAVEVVAAIEREPFVFPLPERRLCANLRCGKPLASLNPDVLCFHCQTLNPVRRDIPDRTEAPHAR